MLNLLDLKPTDTPDYAAPAWVSFLHWAITDVGVVAEYRAATGDMYKPSPYPLDRMIDEATGRTERFIRDFVDWVNVNIWGCWSGSIDA